MTYKQYQQHGLGQIYNVSQSEYAKFEQLWYDALESDAIFRENILLNDTAVPYDAIYGYESALALINAVNIYHQQYNLSNLNSDDAKNASFSKKLQEILRTNSFLSISGNVSFTENGDRDHSIYGFENVVDDNGTVDHIGYYYNGSVIGNFSNIVWPNEFIENGVIPPRSSKQIEAITTEITMPAKDVMFVLSGISMLIVLIALIVMFKVRKNRMIKASAWKLNSITCVGCLLSSITVILYALKPTVFLCNIREWLFAISFTLIFMPLFMKTYRILMIATKLRKVNLKDEKLVFYTFICVLIDILILGIFTGIQVKHVGIQNDELIEINPLYAQQFQHEICVRSDDITKIYWVTLSVWKCIQFVFGFYCALSLSSIGLEQLQKFNETTSQIIAIYVTLVICVISFMIISFKGFNDDTQYYIIFASVILLVSNLVLGVNIIPRLHAVCHGTESKYGKTQTDLFHDELHRKHRKPKLKQLYRSSIHDVTRSGFPVPKKINTKIVEEQMDNADLEMTPIRKMTSKDNNVWQEVKQDDAELETDVDEDGEENKTELENTNMSSEMQPLNSSNDSNINSLRKSKSTAL